jgi:hypothetical protein
LQSAYRRRNTVASADATPGRARLARLRSSPQAFNQNAFAVVLVRSGFGGFSGYRNLIALESAKLLKS